MYYASVPQLGSLVATRCGYPIMPAPGRLINQITIKGDAIRFDYDGRSKEDWTETPNTDLNLPG